MLGETHVYVGARNKERRRVGDRKASSNFQEYRASETRSSEKAGNNGPRARRRVGDGYLLLPRIRVALPHTHTRTRATNTRPCPMTCLLANTNMQYWDMHQLQA